MVLLSLLLVEVLIPLSLLLVEVAAARLSRSAMEVLVLLSPLLAEALIFLPLLLVEAKALLSLPLAEVLAFLSLLLVEAKVLLSLLRVEALLLLSLLLVEVLVLLSLILVEALELLSLLLVEVVGAHLFHLAMEDLDGQAVLRLLDVQRVVVKPHLGAGKAEVGVGRLLNLSFLLLLRSLLRPSNQQPLVPRQERLDSKRPQPIQLF